MNTTKDADLAVRLERLRQDLASQASKTRRGNILTLFVGLLALGALGGYFYWGYSQFSEVLQHERVADSVATLVEDNLPSIRKSLEDEARKSAPTWAEGLSKQLRESLPEGRKKLEDYVIERSKATLAEGTVLTQEQFTKFVQNNKDALKKDMADLAKDPTLAEAAVVDLEKSLESQLDSDLKTDANEMVYILAAFNEKLDKLSKNEKLDQTEAIERRLAMIARRVQSEKVSTAGPVTNVEAAPAVSTGKGSERASPARRIEEARAKGKASADAPQAGGDAKPDAPKEQPK